MEKFDAMAKDHASAKEKDDTVEQKIIQVIPRLFEA